MKTICVNKRCWLNCTCYVHLFLFDNLIDNLSVSKYFIEGKKQNKLYMQKMSNFSHKTWKYRQHWRAGTDLVNYMYFPKEKNVLGLFFVIVFLSTILSKIPKSLKWRSSWKNSHQKILEIEIPFLDCKSPSKNLRSLVAKLNGKDDK